MSAEQGAPFERPDHSEPILTEEQAWDFYKSRAWWNWTPFELVRFQLFQEVMCVSFPAYCESLDQVLGRAIDMSDVIYKRSELRKEFLRKYGSRRESGV